jgi:hypothetical protein
MVYYPVLNGFTTATGGSIDTSFDGWSIFHQILISCLLYDVWTNWQWTSDS